MVAEAQVKVSVLAATAKQDTPPSRWQKLQKLQQKVRRVRDQGQVIRARGSDASGSRAENGTRGPVKDVEMVHIGPGTPAAISNVGCVDTSDNNGMAYQEAPADGEGPGAGSHDKHFSSSTRSDACFVPLLHVRCPRHGIRCFGGGHQIHSRRQSDCTGLPARGTRFNRSPTFLPVQFSHSVSYLSSSNAIFRVRS